MYEKEKWGCSRNLLRLSEVKKERWEEMEGGAYIREMWPQKLLEGHQEGSCPAGLRLEDLKMGLSFCSEQEVEDSDRGGSIEAERRPDVSVVWQGVGELIRDGMVAGSHPDLTKRHSATKPAG